MTLQDRYDLDPEFAKLADEIHHSRLMSGTAKRCEQCLEIAAIQIKGRASKSRSAIDRLRGLDLTLARPAEDL